VNRLLRASLGNSEARHDIHGERSEHHRKIGADDRSRVIGSFPSGRNLESASADVSGEPA
jgi:hypothetical protein